MNDACTRIICDKVSCLHFKTAILLSVNKEIEHRKVLFAIQVFSLQLFNHLKSILVLSIETFESAFSKNEYFISFDILYLDIVHIRLHCKGKIGWKCPGCCRPYHKFYVIIFYQGETDIKRWIADLLIIKLNLKVR